MTTRNNMDTDIDDVEAPELVLIRTAVALVPDAQLEAILDGKYSTAERNQYLDLLTEWAWARSVPVPTPQAIEGERSNRNMSEERMDRLWATNWIRRGLWHRFKVMREARKEARRAAKAKH